MSLYIITEAIWVTIRVLIFAKKVGEGGGEVLNHLLHADRFILKAYES